MNPDQIKKYIKEAHENAIERGFYECPECGGNGFYHPITNGDGDSDGEEVTCHNCNGTGIDPNKNIGELLMLIVSELSEALEAHRCNHFANWDNYNQYFKDIPKSSIDRSYLEEGSMLMHKIEVQAYFENHVKDTFEDEIADVFLRLFDLCGYLGIEAYFEEMETNIDNIGEMLLRTVKEITNYHFTNDKKIWMAFVLSSVDGICKKLNIPIEKHIKAKMAYNKTREHKHGKEY